MSGNFLMSRTCVLLGIACFAAPFQARGQDVAEVVGRVDTGADENKFAADAAAVPLDDASSMIASPTVAPLPAPKPDTAKIMRSEKIEKEKSHHKKKHHKKTHKEKETKKEAEEAKVAVEISHRINVSHKVNLTNKVHWDGTLKTQQKKVAKDADTKDQNLNKVDSRLSDNSDLDKQSEGEKANVDYFHIVHDDLAAFVKATRAARSQDPAATPPPRCQDYPQDFKDSEGDMCYMYEYARLCVPTKMYGQYWSLLKGGNFSKYGVFLKDWGTATFDNGVSPPPTNSYNVVVSRGTSQFIDASFACCACGGGSLPFTTTTTTTLPLVTTAQTTTTALGDPGFHSLVDDDTFNLLMESS